jgi:Yip1 domain
MARGLVDAMLEGYRGPRASMTRLMRDTREDRALMLLMTACGIGFVASMPSALARAERLPTDDPVSVAIAAQLFGFLFLAPLLLYGLAALTHLAARALGGRGSFLGARTALFWSLALTAPVALAIALLGVLLGATVGAAALPWLALLRYAGLAFWLWVFAACLSEAEGFERSWRVAAALAAVYGGLAALLLAAPGAAAPGP